MVTFSELTGGCIFLGDLKFSFNARFRTRINFKLYLLHVFSNTSNVIGVLEPIFSGLVLHAFI